MFKIRTRNLCQFFGRFQRCGSILNTPSFWSSVFYNNSVAGRTTSFVDDANGISLGKVGVGSIANEAIGNIMNATIVAGRSQQCTLCILMRYALVGLLNLSWQELVGQQSAERKLIGQKNAYRSIIGQLIFIFRFILKLENWGFLFPKPRIFLSVNDL